MHVPPFEAELDLTHMVLPTLLQPLSNTCVKHPGVCIFIYSRTVINHASMHAGTEKQGCGCTPARRHMYSHGLPRAYAHVCTSAQSCRYTESIGLFLCRNDLFLDHGGLFLRAGLQPLSCPQAVASVKRTRSPILVPFYLFFCLKIGGSGGGGDGGDFQHTCPLM